MIFGPFSGGNFNPAVTVMMVAKGAQPASDLLTIHCCSSCRRFSSFGTYTNASKYKFYIFF